MSIVYTEGKYRRALGHINHASDTFIAILVKGGSGFYVPDIDHRSLAAVNLASNECSGTGYTASGQALSGLTVTRDDTNNRVIWDAADVSWSNATIPDVHFCIISRKTAQNCTQATGIDTSANTITLPDVDLAPYPYDVNDQVRVTSSITIPGGLTQNGIYYVTAVNTSANYIQVSATQGGAAIDLTSAGSGTMEVLNLTKSPLVVCGFLSKNFTCNMTAGNMYVTLADDSDVPNMVVGGAITHANIPEGSTVSAINSTSGSMRFTFTNATNSPVISSATGATVSVEGVRRQSSNSVFGVEFSSDGIIVMY